MPAISEFDSGRRTDRTAQTDMWIFANEPTCASRRIPILKGMSMRGQSAHLQRGAAHSQSEDGAERRAVLRWIRRWRCLNFSAVEGSAAGNKWIRYVVHIGTHSTRTISCSQLTSRARRTRACEVSLTQHSGGVRGGLLPTKHTASCFGRSLRHAVLLLLSFP